MAKEYTVHDVGMMLHELQTWLKSMDDLIEKLANFEGIDHDRLARMESMIMFVMQKKGLTLNRMPLPDEKIKGKNSRVLYSKSWFEEWREGWEKKEIEHKAKGTEERVVEADVEPGDEGS